MGRKKRKKRRRLRRAMMTSGDGSGSSVENARYGWGCGVGFAYFLVRISPRLQRRISGTGRGGLLGVWGVGVRVKTGDWP